MGFGFVMAIELYHISGRPTLSDFTDETGVNPLGVIAGKIANSITQNFIFHKIKKVMDQEVKINLEEFLNHFNNISTFSI